MKTNWIIDTGASDHMIGDSSNLISIGSSSESIVSTANQGYLTLSNNLTLN